MDTTRLATKITDKIKNVTPKCGFIPEPGDWCSTSCGSDSTAYRIVRVSSDGSEFEYVRPEKYKTWKEDDTLHAMFISKKNAVLFGEWSQTYWSDDKKKFVPCKTCTGVGCRKLNCVTPSKVMVEDYWDPSF